MVKINGRYYIQGIHIVWSSILFVLLAAPSMLIIAVQIHEELVVISLPIMIIGFIVLAMYYSDVYGIPKQRMMVYKLYKQFPEYFYKKYATKQVVDDYTFKRVIDEIYTKEVLWDFIEFNKLEMKYSKEMYDDDTFYNEYETKIVPRIKKNPELIIFRII